MFCILLNDGIMQCMYINMAGAFITIYFWKKTFKAQHFFSNITSTSIDLKFMQKVRRNK